MLHLKGPRNEDHGDRDFRRRCRLAALAVRRRPHRRGHYRLRRMLGDLLGRAFAGSSSALVVHLLQQANPDDEELAEIRAAIEAFEDSREGK